MSDDYEFVCFLSFVLRFVKSIIFDKCNYPGYTNRKVLDKKSFPCNDARTFIFYIASKDSDEKHLPLEEKKLLYKMNHKKVLEAIALLPERLPQMSSKRSHPLDSHPEPQADFNSKRLKSATTPANGLGVNGFS